MDSLIASDVIDLVIVAIPVVEPVLTTTKDPVKELSVKSAADAVVVLVL